MPSVLDSTLSSVPGSTLLRILEDFVLTLFDDEGSLETENIGNDLSLCDEESFG